MIRSLVLVIWFHHTLSYHHSSSIRGLSTKCSVSHHDGIELEVPYSRPYRHRYSGLTIAKHDRWASFRMLARHLSDVRNESLADASDVYEKCGDHMVGQIEELTGVPELIYEVPYIVNYSDRSIAVFGNTKPIKGELKSLGGRFNKYLKQNEMTKAGWIFPMKSKADVEEVLSNITNGLGYNGIGRSSGYTTLSVVSDGDIDVAPYIADYTDRSFAMFGNTKPIKEELKSLGGRFNKNLKQNEVTKVGWIFPMKNKADVEIFLKGLH